MQKLHLVGFTTDQKGLILSARRGARSGSFHLAVDEDLAEAVSELRAKQVEEEAEARQEAAVRPARVESALSVKEIQARLRQGRGVPEVAKAAGVEPEWVERFAAPVFAERAKVIEQVQQLRLRRARLGPSEHTIGDALRHNLAERSVAMSPEEFNAAWTARQLADGRWAVRFHYRHRSRDHTLRFDLDEAHGEVTAGDRMSSQLAYVSPPEPPPNPSPTPRTTSPPSDKAIKRATVTVGFRPDGSVPATSRAARERERASEAMRKAAAQRAADAEKAAARRAREREEAIARREREAEAAEERRLREERAAEARKARAEAAEERARAAEARKQAAAAKRLADERARKKAAEARKQAAAARKRAEQRAKAKAAKERKAAAAAKKRADERARAKAAKARADQARRAEAALRAAERRTAAASKKKAAAGPATPKATTRAAPPATAARPPAAKAPVARSAPTKAPVAKAPGSRAPAEGTGPTRASAPSGPAPSVPSPRAKATPASAGPTSPGSTPLLLRAGVVQATRDDDPWSNAGPLGSAGNGAARQRPPGVRRTRQLRAD